MYFNQFLNLQLAFFHKNYHIFSMICILLLSMPFDILSNLCIMKNNIIDKILSKIINEFY